MPELPQLDYSTPDTEDVIQDYIDAALMESNTCLPGVVKSYDSATQTCTVTPAMKRTTVGGEVSARADIEDVPVVFPRSGTSGMSFPISSGDSVLLVFSQRSLDDWVDNGGVVELTDFRVHDITDAIAIPGLFPTSGKIDPPPADGTDIRGDTIMLGKSGASDEPMVLGNVLQTNLEDLITAIEDLVGLITLGQNIGTGSGTIVSSIVTVPVETALSNVRSALPDENSDFIFGEKS